MLVRISSSSSHQGLEVDIIRKCRFFHVIDTRDNKTIKKTFIQKNVSEQIERYWLHQRSMLRESAHRRTERLRFDRKSKIADEDLNRLLDQNNFVRDQHYEYQIDHFNLQIHSRTLRRALISRRNARKYKMIFIKIISEKNKAVANSIWKRAFTQNNEKILISCALNEQSSCEFDWRIFSVHFAWDEYKIWISEFEKSQW